MGCIENISDDGRLFLKMSGKLAYNDHLEMKRLTRFAVSEKVRSIVIDLKELIFIDSSAIGMLLILADEIGSIGGSLVLENQQGQVERVLRVARLNDVLLANNARELAAMA